MESKPIGMVSKCKDRPHSAESYSGDESLKVSYTKKGIRSSSGENHEDNPKSSCSSKLPSLDLDVQSVPVMDVFKSPPSNYKRKISVLQKRRLTGIVKSFRSSRTSVRPYYYPSSSLVSSIVPLAFATDCDVDMREFWYTLFSSEQDQSEPTWDNKSTSSYGEDGNSINSIPHIPQDIVPFNFSPSIQPNLPLPSSHCLLRHRDSSGY